MMILREPLGKTLNRLPSFNAEIREVDPPKYLYHVTLISLPLALQSNIAVELTAVSWLLGTSTITGGSVKRRNNLCHQQYKCNLSRFTRLKVTFSMRRCFVKVPKCIDDQRIFRNFQTTRSPDSNWPRTNQPPSLPRQLDLEIVPYTLKQYHVLERGGGGGGVGGKGRVVPASDILKWCISLH